MYIVCTTYILLQGKLTIYNSHSTLIRDITENLGVHLCNFQSVMDLSMFGLNYLDLKVLRFIHNWKL